MKLDNKVLGSLVTVVSTFSITHGIYVSIIGEASGISQAALLAFCTFNIFLLPLERWSCEIVGLYTGRRRYLTFRRYTLCFLFGVLAYKAISYRLYGGNIMVAGAVLNITASYLLLNVFFFGKKSGKIFWTKLL